MRRFCLLLMVLLSAVVNSMAVPAYNKPVKVQQPDGTYVTIRLHGDEWLHFNTTTDGYSVVKDSRGYYMYAELNDGRLKATAQVAHDLADRSSQEQAFLANVRKYQVPEMSEKKAAEKARETARRAETLAARRAPVGSSQRAATYDYNNFKGLILLVEYKDQPFSRTDINKVFNDMVNKENYKGYDNSSYGRYTGSVRDYFSDNSGGKFQPQFDVVGPVKIDYSKYYANGTDNISDLIIAALDAADEKVNYKDYDCDNNGQVDMIYFIFTGVGSNLSGNDERLIWPCASRINYFYYQKKDGVSFGRFALSTELYGDEEYSIIDGIGTICHEFSHVLGLPDFYDADYEKSGGDSNHPGIWSVMAGGSYENYGRTPVGYSLYERYSVGFYDEPEVIDAEGSYSLDALYKEGKGFRINTPVNNEFFLFENRQKNAFKWDANLPGSGMLVHRVDKTNNSVWANNTVNNNPSHNYYEVVRAGGDEHPGTARDLFPGTSKVTTLHNNTSPANLKTWAGKSTKWGLTNIKMQNGVITFDVVNTYELNSLSLPATASVGLGLTIQLEPVAEPDFAEYTLTWTSDNTGVATVDKNGNVKGLKVGTANITVKANNGLEASCAVTVEELAPIDLKEFKNKEEGTQVLLQLTNAEVLYVYENTAYVRDAKGSIMFYNTGLNLKKNNLINGSLVARVGVANNMIQVVGVDGATNDSGLTITAGSEVVPREVKLEELTSDDYADYLLVKQAQLLVENKVVMAVSGSTKIRLLVKFPNLSITLNNYNGKYFDLPVIFGTDVLNGSVIDELYLMKTPTEVSAPEGAGIIQPTGISELGTDEADCYNLQGQRVSPTTKGLLIRNGRKFINK